jgi:hypothetical protein
MIFVFPESSAYIGKVDSDYKDEYEMAKGKGHEVVLVNDKFKIKGGSPKGSAIYRGWMMKIHEYAAFYQNCLFDGIALITDPTQYQTAHYINGWYGKLKTMTPETVLVDNVDALRDVELPKWGMYFVKDYVKSLTTKRGSIASNIHEILDVCSQLQKYRGDIEGGIAIRRYENWLPETEYRAFAYSGKVMVPNESCAIDVCTTIAETINLPFISIDLVKNSDGVTRLVEIGDGQVSGYKTWDVGRFYQLFA